RDYKVTGVQTCALPILVDTSVIVAWLDRAHSEHKKCRDALELLAGRDQLAVSSVTYAELAAGARSREGVDEELKAFERLDLDFEIGRASCRERGWIAVV